jgi:hypothetical protein
MRCRRRGNPCRPGCLVTTAKSGPGARTRTTATIRNEPYVAHDFNLPRGVMHPPLGWLSCGWSGIGPTYGTRFPQLGPRPQRQVRVQRPDLKLRVSTRVEGGESEPRNYRDHHRGLDHYHFGDSDPADDLARAAPRGRPRGTSTPARVQAGVRSVRSGVVTHQWLTHSRRWDGIG